MSQFILQGLGSVFLVTQGYGFDDTPPVVVTDACACLTAGLQVEAVLSVSYAYEAILEVEVCECQAV